MNLMDHDEVFLIMCFAIQFGDEFIAELSAAIIARDYILATEGYDAIGMQL